MRFEADVLPGLESLLLPEFPDSSVVGRGRIGFEVARYKRVLHHPYALGIYRVLTFEIPRPKALLGQQYFDQLLKAAREILALHPTGAFRTLRLSAAGDDTPVMQRLKAELARAMNLTVDSAKSDDADMLLRLRPVKGTWEALLSISPRPLSSRAWRVCDMPGALNATLAHTMARLTAPAPTDTVLNLCCGSGTLLIERAQLGECEVLIGCDTNPDALLCARKNTASARLSESITLEDWDATDLPLQDSCVDVILADLPFGQRIGSHKENEVLYPALFEEAARVARPDARFCFVTHEIKLTMRSLGSWKLEKDLQVAVGGMHPGVFLVTQGGIKC